MKIKAAELIQKLQKEKKPMLILGLGLLGLMLIVFSSGGKSEKAVSNGQSFDLPAYERQLGDNLKKMISKIEGAGKTEVLLTVDCSPRSVYAEDEKRNSQQKKTDGQQQSDSTTENNYIIMKQSGSVQSGLLLVTYQPNVRGVAVICDGGDSPVVRQTVTQAVCAALGISAARVSVSKMKT